MKYRLIERNDGKFQYEYGYKDTYSDLILWNRIEYMTFSTEEAARHSVQTIISFARSADVKRIVEEIEV